MTHGVVVWFTGLPGSGKTTLAKSIRDQLRVAGIRAHLMDGDDVRRLVTPSLGYSEDDRAAFYRTLAGLAAQTALEGEVVLVSATAHRAAFRERARELAPDFIEVYVATPLEVCEQRDEKQLYSAAREGRIQGLPGVDVPFEEPQHPDVVANGGHDASAVEAVVEAVNNHRRWTVSENGAKRFKVVVAYDFSDLAELALERALGAVQAHPHADLHVIGVLEVGHGSTYQDADTLQKEITSVVDARIEKPTSTDMHLFVHVRLGHAAKEILELAAEANADVIILGTHGRQGVRRWLMGSVAEKVVRHAGCPVLVVRPKAYYEGRQQETGQKFAPEPPCEQCVAKRAETEGKEWWCESHGSPHAKPHTYRYRATTATDASDHSNSIIW